MIGFFRLTLALLLLLLPLCAQAEGTAHSGYALQDALPCKSPGGSYPWILEQKDGQGELLFALVCKGEGRTWQLLLPESLFEPAADKAREEPKP